METYRKKPVEVQAIRFIDPAAGMAIIATLKDWGVQITGSQGVDLQGRLVPLLIVQTPHGETACRIGDWVVRDADGGWYPCTDSVFQKCYEPVVAEVPQ